MEKVQNSLKIEDPERTDGLPNVLLYIDNSNIFETAKQYSARQKGYRSECPDVACRIDLGALMAKAVGNRNLLVGRLYGSEPPALDTVWAAIRKKQLQVDTFQRSKVTGKEKQIDTTMTAHSVRDIVVNHETAGNDRVVILLSGDRDLLSVVEIALEFNYKVEIWSFRFSINREAIKRENEKPTMLSIKYIDEIFNEITFTTYKWRQSIPLERSLVATVNIQYPPSSYDNKEVKKLRMSFLKDFVAKAGEIFALPMMGRYMQNPKYIVLIPCHFEIQKVPKAGGEKTAGRRLYSFDKHIQPFTHQLMEKFPGVCVNITTYLEFLCNGNASQAPDFESSYRFQQLSLSEPTEQLYEEEEDEETESEHINFEDIDLNNFFDFNLEYVDTDDEDDFVPEVRKRSKRSTQKYSDPCMYKFWCSKGRQCEYGHSEKERAYFKRIPDAKHRALYKIKQCYYYLQSRCNFKEKSYLCSYAHSLKEARCLICKKNGEHWMDECPKKGQRV